MPSLKRVIEKWGIFLNQNVNSLQSTIFDGKVVIVSGASHGIGEEICEKFLKHGANVVGVDILKEELDTVLKKMNKWMKKQNRKNSFETYVCDLTNQYQVKKLVDDTIKKHKKIDVLVNNAGGVCGQVHQKIENVSDEDWKRIVDINLNAVFYTTKFVVPHMKEQSYGKIVNISSGAGRSTSLTGIQAYASAKAGQIGLTRQMAQELGPYGITVNNVAPGFVISNPSTQKQWERMTKVQQESLVDSISVKRLGNPEDIAHPVLFLASDFASYISGQTISADGGQQLF